MHFLHPGKMRRLNRTSKIGLSIWLPRKLFLNAKFNGLHSIAVDCLAYIFTFSF